MLWNVRKGWYEKLMSAHVLLKDSVDPSRDSASNSRDSLRTTPSSFTLSLLRGVKALQTPRKNVVRDNCWVGEFQARNKAPGLYNTS